MITGTVARVIVAELEDDPLTRGYSAMNDAERLTDLNTVYRERNRDTMSGSEILQAVDAAEWAALTADEQRTVWDVVHLSDVNPFGVESTLMIGVFGAGSDTISALADARKEDISRSEELIGKDLEDTPDEWGKVLANMA